MERKILLAEPGQIYTDGTIYGETISLAIDRDISEFYQISLEEYENLIKD